MLILSFGALTTLAVKQFWFWTKNVFFFFILFLRSNEINVSIYSKYDLTGATIERLDLFITVTVILPP